MNKLLFARASILGGIAIGLGCIAYISVDNRYLGAFLFSIGLLTICSRGWGLFTGQLCKSKDVLNILLSWICNFYGIAIIRLVYRFSSSDFSVAENISITKLNRPLSDVLFSAFLCEICIYIAVIGYSKIQSDIGRNLSIILGVMVFILCGFEHCIADMFYWWFSPITSSSVLFLLYVTCGNIAGALVCRLLDFNNE